jgi:hypothetical protein
LPCDSRIKAAGLADPAPSVAFTKNTLAPIPIPFQIWRSELGARDRGVDAMGVARVIENGGEVEVWSRRRIAGAARAMAWPRLAMKHSVLTSGG